MWSYKQYTHATFSLIAYSSVGWRERETFEIFPKINGHRAAVGFFFFFLQRSPPIIISSFLWHTWKIMLSDFKKSWELESLLTDFLSWETHSFPMHDLNDWNIKIFFFSYLFIFIWRLNVLSSQVQLDSREHKQTLEPICINLLACLKMLNRVFISFFMCAW